MCKGEEVPGSGWDIPRGFPSWLFTLLLPLPLLAAECSYKDGGSTKLNPPLVIAWSSSGRNHFIPLIHVKGKPLPRLPVGLQPKVWGVNSSLLLQYVTLQWVCVGVGGVV